MGRIALRGIAAHGLPRELPPQQVDDGSGAKARRHQERRADRTELRGPDHHGRRRPAQAGLSDLESLRPPRLRQAPELRAWAGHQNRRRGGIQLHRERSQAGRERLRRPAGNAEHSQRDLGAQKNQERGPRMTQRERNMMRILIVLGGVVAPALLIWMWLLSPYLTGRSELAALEEEINDKDALIAVKLKEKRQVERFRFMSLSGSPNQAAEQYQNFLRPVIDNSGLRLEKLHSQVPDPKTIVTAPGKKGPPHTVIPFNVDAKGDLASVVKFLELMEKASYAHRVKSLNLTQDSRDNPGWLNVKIAIETMIVAKAERHANLAGRLAALDALNGLRRGPIGIAMVPWALSPVGPTWNDKNPEAKSKVVVGKPKPEGRADDYAAIAKRNPFIGLVKAPPQFSPEVDVGEIDTEPSGPDMRKWWTLSEIRYTNQDNFSFRPRMATLRNWFEGPGGTLGYQKLLDIPMSGYDKFRIRDESGKRDLVTAQVLKIDDREVYFSVEGKYYSIYMGQSVLQAMKQQVPRAQLERLGILKATASEKMPDKGTAEK